MKRWQKISSVYRGLASLMLVALTALWTGNAVAVFAVMAAVSVYAPSCLGITPNIGINIGTAPVTGGLTDILKTYDLPGIANAVVTHSYLYNRLSAMGIVRIEGKEAEGRVRVGRGMAYGFVPDSGTLPVPRDQSYITIKNMPSNFWAVVGFNSNEEELSRTNLGAFAPILQEKMLDTEEGAKDLLNVAAQGYRSGYLGRVAGTPAAGVITLDNDSLIHTTAKTRTCWIRVGMPLAAIRSGVVVQNKMLVTAIDEVNDTITVTVDGVATSGAVADNDFLVLGHLGGANASYNVSVTGLADWLGSASTTVWNVDRSTAANALYRPQRLTPAQGESLETVLNRAKMTVWKRGANQGGTMDPSRPEEFAWLTSGEGVRTLGLQLLQQRKYVSMADVTGSRGVKLSGGFTALDCDGVPMVPDASMPLGHFYGLNWNDWQLHSVTGNVQLVPVIVNGSPLQKVPFHDLNIIELKANFELLCQMPNRQVDVYGVTMDPLV